ncbi:uncharacterized protein LOC142766118 [Rhipicephalus microplus]|uniref:uncharacterized protein LOC142766118 n=1 Tax=Rhipicephalus microplus TaxID=6941 RepID=UPI003F6B8F82
MKSTTTTTTPSTTPKSTTKLSTKSKTTMTTPSTTPKSTTKLSTKSATTTTTPEPELKEVLCTVGHSAVTTNMYPPEFPCDYLYYTSVVILKKEVMATEVQTSWTTFQAMAKNYTRLISGMSFDYRYFSHHQLQPAIPALNALAQARIGSYGILNIVASPEDLRTAVYKMRQGIQTLKRWQSTNPMRRSVIALGSTDYSGENYTDTFKNLVKSVIKESKGESPKLAPFLGSDDRSIVSGLRGSIAAAVPVVT